MDRIKSVAWKEIPWIGSLKLMMNGNGELGIWAGNSVTMLVLLFLSVIVIVI